MAWFLVIMLIGNWGQGPPFRPRIWQRPENERSKFYQLLSEDEKVDLGCCLIPTTGCLIGLYNRFQKDTAKMIQKVPLESLSFWQRLRFGIGYSGGVCWTGKDLMERTETEFNIDPSVAVYYLNSIEISTLYKLGNNQGIEVGLNYGWTHLSNRVGWDKMCRIEGRDVYLQGMYSCEIKNISVYLSKIDFTRISLGGELTYAEVKSSETISEKSWETIDWAIVSRRCLGAGAIIKLVPRYSWGDKLKIFPVVSFKISGVFEIWNDSPWKECWNRNLFLSFSGMYGGVKLSYGRMR